MGWGLGYTMCWWFAGPLTLFPLAQRMPLNWSMNAASNLFGALVGFILYGLKTATSFPVICSSAAASVSLPC